ncbi:MAG: hypothetical protein Q8P56_00290 [Candidatus Uhrbacteria bacterium]|nr:hypothetical protein [Candidatus Uhrbacteria bacterium]
MEMIIIKFVFALNLILLAADHIFTGALGMFFPKRAARVYSKLFGAEIPEKKEYLVILKPWGALGIFAGLVGLLPVIDPEKYIWILCALVALLFMRLMYRLKFQKEAESSLKLTRERNLSHVGLILLCVSVIIAQIIFYSR